MTLGQIVIFAISLAGIAYFVRKIIVDLGFPRSFIDLFKRYECPVCHKKLWTTWSKCCEGTPEYEAWMREVKRRRKSKPRSYHDMERDCPRCHGKPGNYMCPMCEGRGKTFIK